MLWIYHRNMNKEGLFIFLNIYSKWTTIGNNVYFLNCIITQIRLVPHIISGAIFYQSLYWLGLCSFCYLWKECAMHLLALLTIVLLDYFNVAIGHQSNSTKVACNMGMMSPTGLDSPVKGKGWLLLLVHKSSMSFSGEHEFHLLLSNVFESKKLQLQIYTNFIKLCNKAFFRSKNTSTTLL